MHVNASFIFERLSKIAELNLVSDWQLRGYLVVKENIFDQKTLIEEIKNTSLDTLLIIDYLQAITSNGDSEPYQGFLQVTKTIVKQHASRMLNYSNLN